MVNQRDELWDELVRVCGGDASAMTKSERGKYNKALKELREVGATADDIRTRVREYRSRWPHISVTPMALVMHWSSLKPAAPRYIDVVREPEPELTEEQRQENLLRFRKLVDDVVNATE